MKKGPLALFGLVLGGLGTRADWTWSGLSGVQRFALGLAAAAGLTLLLLWLTLPPPQVRAVLHARAERFELRVTATTLAAFHLGGMRARAAWAEGEGRCVEGLLEPAQGVVLRFLRPGRGPWALAIEDAAPAAGTHPRTLAVITDGAGGGRIRLDGAHDLRADPRCPGLPPARLPVHGMAEFGREYGPSGPAGEPAGLGHLRDGRLVIYGHAVDRLAGVVPLPASMFQVADMRLPGGARVGAARTDGLDAVWWGLALAEPDAPGFLIDATTTADRIRLFMPAADGQGGTVVLGDFLRLTEDPNVFRLFLAGSLLFQLLPGLLLWLFRADPAAPAQEAPPAKQRRLRPSRRRTRHGGLLLLALALPGAAVAEPVRLLPGGPDSGQGWLFTGPDGACRIVTAAHVLARRGGLAAPVAVDRRGVEFPTAQPLQPDPALDLAFLVARPARPCPPGGLPETGLENRLAATPTAYLEVMDGLDIVTLPLLRRARAMDEDAGRILLFEAGGPGPGIQRSMSGAMVVDAGARPLAVLIETRAADNRRALAVRADVAGVLLRAATAGAAPATGYGWSVAHGRSVDPLRGPAEMAEGGRGWEVAPARGFVVVVVRPPAPQRVAGMVLRVDEAARGVAGRVMLRATPDPARPPATWPPLASCAFPPGSAVLACRFAPREVAAVQLTLALDAPRIALSGFALLPE